MNWISRGVPGEKSRNPHGVFTFGQNARSNKRSSKHFGISQDILNLRATKSFSYKKRFQKPTNRSDTKRLPPGLVASTPKSPAHGSVPWHPPPQTPGGHFVSPLERYSVKSGSLGSTSERLSVKSGNRDSSEHYSVKSANHDTSQVYSVKSGSGFERPSKHSSAVDYSSIKTPCQSSSEKPKSPLRSCLKRRPDDISYVDTTKDSASSNDSIKTPSDSEIEAIFKRNRLNRENEPILNLFPESFPNTPPLEHRSERYQQSTTSSLNHFENNCHASRDTSQLSHDEGCFGYSRTGRFENNQEGRAEGVNASHAGSSHMSHAESSYIGRARSSHMSAGSNRVEDSHEDLFEAEAQRFRDLFCRNERIDDVRDSHFASPKNTPSHSSWYHQTDISYRCHYPDEKYNGDEATNCHKYFSIPTYHNSRADTSWAQSQTRKGKCGNYDVDYVQSSAHLDEFKNLYSAEEFSKAIGGSTLERSRSVEHGLSRHRISDDRSPFHVTMEPSVSRQNDHNGHRYPNMETSRTMRSSVPGLNVDDSIHHYDDTMETSRTVQSSVPRQNDNDSSHRYPNMKTSRTMESSVPWQNVNDNSHHYHDTMGTSRTVEYCGITDYSKLPGQNADDIGHHHDSVESEPLHYKYESKWNKYLYDGDQLNNSVLNKNRIESEPLYYESKWNKYLYDGDQLNSGLLNKNRIESEPLHYETKWNKYLYNDDQLNSSVLNSASSSSSRKSSCRSFKETYKDVLADDEEEGRDKQKFDKSSDVHNNEESNTILANRNDEKINSYRDKLVGCEVLKQNPTVSGIHVQNQLSQTNLDHLHGSNQNLSKQNIGLLNHNTQNTSTPGTFPRSKIENQYISLDEKQPPKTKVDSKFPKPNSLPDKSIPFPKQPRGTDTPCINSNTSISPPPSVIITANRRPVSKSTKNKIIQSDRYSKAIQSDRDRYLKIIYEELCYQPSFTHFKLSESLKRRNTSQVFCNKYKKRFELKFKQNVWNASTPKEDRNTKVRKVDLPIYTEDRLKSDFRSREFLLRQAERQSIDRRNYMGSGKDSNDGKNNSDSHVPNNDYERNSYSFGHERKHSYDAHINSCPSVSSNSLGHERRHSFNIHNNSCSNVSSNTLGHERRHSFNVHSNSCSKVSSNTFGHERRHSFNVHSNSCPSVSSANHYKHHSTQMPSVCEECVEVCEKCDGEMCEKRYQSDIHKRVYIKNYIEKRHYSPFRRVTELNDQSTQTVYNLNEIGVQAVEVSGQVKSLKTICIKALASVYFTNS